eukprot:762801-Hanusia_phi.AAC.1
MRPGNTSPDAAAQCPAAPDSDRGRDEQSEPERVTVKSGPYEHHLAVTGRSRRTGPARTRRSLTL